MPDVIERVETKKFYTQNQTFSDVTLPTGAKASVGDTEIKEGAKISGSKTRRRMHVRYNQGNVAAATFTGIIHIAYGVAGEILAVRVGNIVRATGTSAVTVDVQKNGVTILTGVVTLDVTHPASAGLQFLSGTVVASPANAYAANDIFTVVVTATAGTGALPTGLFVEMLVDEDPN